MKVAVMSYHKNIYQIYPEKWIEAYRNSIENQTEKRFTIYEINYGEQFGMIFFKSKFKSKKFETFVHCMNYMLDWLFRDCGYDYVFNTNADDIYHPAWVEKSLAAIIGRKYDLVSCNFSLINEEGSIYHIHNFNKLNIANELNKDHNIICHPGVCYSKNFWLKHGPYIPEEIPFEDMKLWQRAISNGAQMFIHPEHLVLHRVHKNSVSSPTLKHERG